MKKRLNVKLLILVFILTAVFVFSLNTGYSAVKKSVITSVSLDVSAKKLTVIWNQLRPVEQCYVEVTSSDLNYFYSPTPVPDDPGYVPCDSAGVKTGISEFPDSILAKIPLYATIADNVTGEILSDYVLIAGEPGQSHSPPQTPPVRVPLSRVLAQ